MSRFKRDFIKEMKQNAMGQNFNPIDCPKCGNPVPLPVDAALFGKDFSCPKCGVTITPTGDAPMAEGIADMVEKGFKDFGK